MKLNPLKVTYTLVTISAFFFIQYTYAEGWIESTLIALFFICMGILIPFLWRTRKARNLSMLLKSIGSYCDLNAINDNDTAPLRGFSSFNGVGIYLKVQPLSEGLFFYKLGCFSVIVPWDKMKITSRGDGCASVKFLDAKDTSSFVIPWSKKIERFS